MVIVGEPGDDAVLGATTLEGFGLVLDPFRRELRPMALPLKAQPGAPVTAVLTAPNRVRLFLADRDGGIFTTALNSVLA